MLKLRPYKSCDAQAIAKWVQDKDVFTIWGGERFGNYPITADIIDKKYQKDNGDCTEPDNFYPWTAFDDNGIVGHFIMRYINGDPKVIRFGWVVVGSSARGKGYGTKMLRLGVKVAFEILGAEKITIGVFENNTPAHTCYKKVGFVDVGVTEDEPWNIIEMEINKTPAQRFE